MHDDRTNEAAAHAVRPENAADAGVDMAAPDEDTELAARRAIEWLSGHSLVVSVGFPENDPPSEAARRLLAPYMVGMENDIGDLACRYLMQSAATRLGLGGIETP